MTLNFLIQDWHMMMEVTVFSITQQMELPLKR